MKFSTEKIRFMTQRPVVLLSIACMLIGIGIGWFAHTRYPSTNYNPNPSTPLRLNGYQFISPLLLCDSHFDQNSKSLDAVQKDIENYLNNDSGITDNSIVSVYFRYLNSGEEFGINPDEKFFPASIKKLPLLIQYLKESESNPSLLSEKGIFLIDKDMNSPDVYPPKEALVSGNKYTIDTLLEYMIKYSDNNSFGVLYPYIGALKADKIYENMRLYFPDTYTSKEDYITTYQVSLFFRMLYNATYLNYDNSEKALGLLSKTDFKEGLVKKLPASVFVAHKFGISADKRPDGKLYGELHDCGIVYKGRNPYILCVMTKSQSTDINILKDIIAEISSITYQKTSN